MSKIPKNFGAFGADFTKKTIGFIPPAGLLPPEANFFKLFAPFCDDFALKNIVFPMQNAESKYQIPKIFACGAMVLPVLPFYPPPCSKTGNSKGG